MANPIIQSYSQNILKDAEWSGSDPIFSYFVETFERKNPAERVAYLAGTRTVSASLDESMLGDIVCIPCGNYDTVTLTNGAGLSESLLVPAMPADGHPLTLVADLTALEPNASVRTSSSWTFTFTKADGTLYLGGALLIFGPKTQFEDWSFQWGGTAEVEPFGVDHQNQYGTRYLQDFQTIERRDKLTKIATPGERIQYEAWFRGNGFLPGMVWPDPDVNDAYFGTVQLYSSERTAPYFAVDDAIYTLQISIRELSKGKPV